MFKNIIQKKNQIINKRKLKENIDDGFKDMVCKDCQEAGHANKSYYKCKFYKEASADDVGTSAGKKRKQSSGVKQEKPKAKRQKTAECSSWVICTSCKQTGHRSTRPPDCPNHILSKNEVFSRNLRQQFKTFTRKLLFDQCVHSSYQSALKPKIVSACEDTRQIVFKAQLFINQYTLNLKVYSNHIFKQNFWYSICQLVMDKRVTNSAVLPEGLLKNWNLFRQSHKSIIYIKKLASETSQCLSEACVQLATTYTNCIVENFEARLLKYLSYLIQNTFVSMAYQDVKKIIYDYCYQYVCKGELKWPQGATFTQETKTAVDEACLPLQQLITTQVTLKELSASPSAFLPCILYILSAYEVEHKEHHAYDVRRLSLPRLFSILPNSSLHWRFINISANSLSAFVKERLPRGYDDQLRLFYRIFNFKKLRINR